MQNFGNKSVHKCAQNVRSNIFKGIYFISKCNKKTVEYIIVSNVTKGFFYVFGSRAAVISSQKLSIFSSQFGHLILTIDHHTNFRSLGILSIGMSSLMITMIDRSLLLWNAWVTTIWTVYELQPFSRKFSVTIKTTFRLSSIHWSICSVLDNPGRKSLSGRLILSPRLLKTW